MGVWRFDSPKVEAPDKFQFPIESCEKVFSKRRSTLIKGISQEHIVMIERVQPCNGCNWTRLLVTISNLDKHWELVPLDLYINSFTEQFDTEGNSDEDSVYVNTVYEREITFSDGTPVIEALQEIQTQIAQLFEEFNACLMDEYRARVEVIKQSKK
jgi:hypothetical protein